MKMMPVAAPLLAFVAVTNTAWAQQPPEPPAAPVVPAAPTAPVAPAAPAVPAPIAPDFRRDFQRDFDFNFDFQLEKQIKEQTKTLKEQAKALAEQFKSQEFQETMLELKAESAEIRRRAREYAWQFPVPPVPPVPPKDPRQKPRDRERRRIPEGWVEATEPFTRSFPVGKGATLMLSNISGNIQIVPGSATSIEVEALTHAWGQNAEAAKQRLADAVIETYASGNRVEVRVEHGQRRDARGVDVEFNVKVPGDASVDLRTVSGDVRVTNVKGELRVQAISGNVVLEGTAKIGIVKTVSGDLTINNGGSDQQISLSTVNGDLQVQTLTARAIDLDTINGDVRIAGWSGDRAHIRSLDGDLDVQASLAKGGRYEIESHSGNINLSLPEQPGFELEANTFNGRIRIDFPIRSEGPIRDSDRGPRSVRGTYGDASSSLRLQTFNGNLTVTRR
jgi:DUF4097 and DUF4098 domain-containing protein YvlB